MSDSIITGLFTLSGTLLGGIITFLIQKKSDEFNRLKSDVKMLSRQIIAYWNLEKMYSEELGAKTSMAKKTILQNFRDKVEKAGIERPTLTEKEAKKILEKYHYYK